jgi:5'(3')-deoxyribonucleotidase
MAIIGIDIDDTVISFVEAWLKWYRRDSNEEIYVNDITDWNIAQFVKVGDRIYDYINDPKLYQEVKEIWMAKWAVTNLRKMGHRVIFPTSCPIGLPHGEKLNTLNKMGFKIDHKDYMELKDKTLLNMDVLIDDNFDTISKFSGLKILFAQPWNSKELGGYDFRSGNWVDIMKFLKEKI